MVARIALGQIGGLYKLSVSKPGVDVFSAGFGDLIFDSEASHIRVIQAGQAIIPANQLTVTVPISGLGGGPAFAQILLDGNDSWYYPTNDTTMDKVALTSTLLTLTRLNTVPTQTRYVYQVVGF